MNKRYLGALMLSPIIIFLFLGGNILKYGIMVLSLMGMYEFYKVNKEKNINAISALGYILCIIYYFSIEKSINYNLTFNLVIITLFILLCIPIINIKFNYIDLAITIFGFLYVGVMFSFIPLISLKENGNMLLWLIFISSWMCDTSAYYVGLRIGKRKLCPNVSPKKTIEGSIGGLLGSTISCGVFGLYLYSKGVNIPLYHYFIIGALSGVFSQFGDLTASSIKRIAKVKDYSNLIPGHGGVLDRFDSILFSSFIVYFYLTLIIKI